MQIKLQANPLEFGDVGRGVHFLLIVDGRTVSCPMVWTDTDIPNRETSRLIQEMCKNVADILTEELYKGQPK